jgi:uncharacterized Fe-S center protein
MKAKVYFSTLETNHFHTIFDIINNSFLTFTFLEKIKKNNHVGIKIHFGEWGNLNYIRPQYLIPIIEQLKTKTDNIFLTDTNTLYAGMRKEAVNHIINGIKNGFGYSNTGVPIIIADGIKGNNYALVPVNGKHFSKVKIGSDIYYSDALVVLSHFKFHEIAEFGGAIKNLGMGCASKTGKYEIHSESVFTINRRCTACKKCMEFCPQNAISIFEKKATISREKCVMCGACFTICNHNAINLKWNSKKEIFIEKLIEYAKGAVQNKKDKVLYINFLTNIAEYCDCINYTPPPLINDIGVLVSEDPLACDKASLDLILQNDKSGKIVQLVSNEIIDSFYTYAEQIGLGVKEYELIDISQSNKASRKNKLAKNITSKLQK